MMNDMSPLSNLKRPEISCRAVHVYKGGSLGEIHRFRNCGGPVKPCGAGKGVALTEYILLSVHWEAANEFCAVVRVLRGQVGGRETKRSSRMSAS